MKIVSHICPTCGIEHAVSDRHGWVHCIRCNTLSKTATMRDAERWMDTLQQVDRDHPFDPINLLDWCEHSEREARRRLGSAAERCEAAYNRLISEPVLSPIDEAKEQLGITD